MSGPPGSLLAFSPHDAEVVAGWTRGQVEVEAWCSLIEPSVAPETIVAWSAAQDVEAFVYVIDGEPVGYGELWFDDDEGEVELAHLLVDAGRRNQAIGQHLVRALTEHARLRHEFVVLRVRAENVAAVRCYERAGYGRVQAAEEAVWNQHQPHDYVWMSAAAPA